MTVKLCERSSETVSVLEEIFSVGEVACALGAQCKMHWIEIPVSRVVTDSRQDCTGALFVALKGDNFDGHDYTCDAFARGAVASVVSEIPSDADPEWPLLVVEETLSALADLAAYYRRLLSIPVVGITGSCGKTTTKELLAAALSPVYHVAKPEASFNNIIGVSLTILSVRHHHEVLILELGTSAPGEIEALCEIGRPTLGIITNIGNTHLEKLGSIDGVKKEKSSLIEFLGEGGVLVTNVDCPECRELADGFRGQVATVAVEEQADHSVEIQAGNDAELVFKYDGITSSLQTAGTHNAVNAGMAAACAEILGVGTAEALQAMSGASLPSMRMEREIVGGVLLVNDAYNSNFESLKAAVETLDRSTAPGRRILVCGDMLELGRASESLHRAIGWHIGRSSVDVLVTVGASAEFIAAEAHKGGTKVIYHRNSVAQTGVLLERMVRPGDMVLFKASRGIHLERAAERLRRALQQEPVNVGS